MRGDQRGFTLVELLVVVAIIGIIAAIGVANLLNAIDRGKQKQTMADLRSIGTAIETYQVDTSYYPRGFAPAVPLSSMASHFEGPYLREVPETDGWGYGYSYGSDLAGAGYTLRSAGRDGINQPVFGATTDFDCDIIFQVGSFTAFPKGKQEN